MLEIKIDIVIPTLNSENTIHKTLLSVVHLEKYDVLPVVVVVDSDSNDSTRNIVSRYKIRLLNFPKGNMYKAINYGLRSGSSAWCTYLNSDDIIYPEIFSYNLHKLADKNADIGYGNINFINMDGLFLHRWNSPLPNDIAGIYKLKISPIPQPGTLFSRILFEKLNGFDDKYKYSADTDFFYRSYLCKAKFMKGSNRPVAAFRLHQNQFSQIKLSDMKNEGLLIFKNYGKKSNVFLLKYIRIKILIRNIDNYIIRILRWWQLYRSFKIPRSNEIHRVF